MRGVLVGAAPRAARNRNTAKCGVKRLRGARGAPPTSEGKSTYFIAGAIASHHLAFSHLLSSVVFKLGQAPDPDLAAFAPHCQQMTNVISFAPFDDHFGCGRPEIFPLEAVLFCISKTTPAKPF